MTTEREDAVEEDFLCMMAEAKRMMEEEGTPSARAEKYPRLIWVVRCPQCGEDIIREKDPAGSMNFCDCCGIHVESNKFFQEEIANVTEEKFP